MFKNVLVGVDGSSNSRDAIALASRLIDSQGKLTLVNVDSGGLPPLDAITPGLVAEQRDLSRLLLESERLTAGVPAELVSVVGLSPGRGLHEQAEKQGADLLVVGSCSRGAFGRAMLGDDTRAALNGSPCAVAIASLGYAERPAPFTRVGVGYNDSQESKAALALARELAASTKAALSALEVVSIPTYAYTALMPPGIGESIELMLKAANTRMGELEDVEGRAVYGLAGEELAAFGNQLDILLVGSRGYGPVRRLVLGSTSEYLERHARCSLLVVPRAAAEPAGGDAGEESQTAARPALPVV